jgi:hypothetical protein
VTRLSALLLLPALALGCAEGELGDPGEASVSGEVDAPDAFDAGLVTEDTSTVPADDVFTVPADDVFTVPIDDTPAPRPDAPVSPDLPRVDDAPAPAVDVVAASDRPAPAPDVVTAVDAARADAGLSCASPLTACGGRCVNTATDAQNCGACGAACAGATPMCASSRCAAAACGNGASDCDGNTANGCERSHLSQGVCGAAPTLGAWCGDVSCGFLCPSNSSRVVATRTGTAGAWFRGRTNECSNCPARLDVTFTLTVPPGVDYDLYVYEACGGAAIGRSLLLEGQTDRVNIQRSGDLGSDSFNWFVEVRYVRGSSCAPWSLTVETRSGSASDC